MRIEVFIATTILWFAGFIWLWRHKRLPKGLEFPPGPPGKPIVGNSGDMPKHHGWEKYTQWAKEYGDLVHVKVFGQSMVFVNSLEVARELFDRRSSLYSDRVQFVMMTELIGFDWAFTRMRYGERWRKHRRMFHQYFHPNASIAYYDIQTKHTRGLIHNFHKSPQDFVAHIRQLAGAIILEIAYGIKVLPKGDPYIGVAEKALSAAAQAENAGTFLVDIIPILKYVPAWMPGAGFKRKARIWRIPVTEIVERPFNMVKQAVKSGTAPPSMTASLLEDQFDRKDPPPDQEETIRNSAAIAYAAGSDTIVSSLSSFILAMVLNLESQRKAQEELDRVVGIGRPPAFEDRKELPYVNALCKEVLRWHPVLPLSLAHRVTQDDVYGCYLIPEGSFIFGNSWAILHDEKLFGSIPQEFRPERFLDSEAPDPIFAFGFGRRICPGRYMADNTLFMAIASILQVFNISHEVDVEGIEIPVTGDYTSGMISFPKPFRCSITIRSASAESLILEHPGP